MDRYKARKTNEIWLLGEIRESGTLDSVDLFPNRARRGYTGLMTG
jgi:hypothetical protein